MKNRFFFLSFVCDFSFSTSYIFNLIIRDDKRERNFPPCKVI